MSFCHENTLKLYELLRVEIQNNIQLNNKISLFSFSVTAAILAFAIASGKAPLCLIPLLIMLPLAAKSTYYRKNQLIIASYLLVRVEPSLDGVSWETDLANFRSSIFGLVLLSVRNFEFVLEGIICIILYMYFAGISDLSIFLLGISVTILVALFVMCLMSCVPSFSKAKFVSKWEETIEYDIKHFN